MACRVCQQLLDYLRGAQAQAPTPVQATTQHTKHPTMSTCRCQFWILALLGKKRIPYTCMHPVTHQGSGQCGRSGPPAGAWPDPCPAPCCWHCHDQTASLQSHASTQTYTGGRGAAGTAGRHAAGSKRCVTPVLVTGYGAWLRRQPELACMVEMHGVTHLCEGIYV